MSDDKLTITYEKPAGWKPTERGRLGTDHLPAAVTAQPLAVSVWSTTELVNEGGRPEGFFTFALSLAGRQNPTDLSDDEREYVACVLERAADIFRDRDQPFAVETE